MTEINFVVNVYTFYNHAVLYDESINKYDSMLMRVIQSNGYLGTLQTPQKNIHVVHFMQLYGLLLLTALPV